MKKMFYMMSFALITISLFGVSCSSENMTEEMSCLDKDEKKSISHAISMEQALMSLQFFLNDSTEDRTRSSIKDRKIKDVFAVKYETEATRGTLYEDLDCENLLYIANFEGEQGFAVLAADDRIKHEILAVTEEGTLSNEDMDSAMENLLCEERPIIEGYPLTGDGFFTVNDYPDEVFMNPNTVSLYDPDEDDSLVGNFDETDDEDITRAMAANSTSIEGNRGRMVGAMCLAYTMEQIIIDDDGRIGGGNSSSRTEVTTAWSTEKIVYPLLGSYRSWNQSSPFNDFYPQKRKYLFFGKKRNAPAGCFPLAIAKIITHFERPNTFKYNGVAVNWNQLKTNLWSEIGKKSAASLLRGISSGCSSWYFYAGTFTFPGRATSYMRFVGYNDAHSYNYSFPRVTEMIDKGCPLIIYGVPGINIFNSHAWNIDGYKIKVKTTTIKTYVGNTLQRETTRTEPIHMVHCDFGWGGPYNGYYVSGVFNSNDSRTEFDNNSYNQSKKKKYNTLVKIIKYDKPM